MNPRRCQIDQPATKSSCRPNAICVAARTIVQVDFANQLQLSRERYSGLPDVRFTLSRVCHGYQGIQRVKDRFVTIDTTKDYSMQAYARILWRRQRAATSAALQFRAVTMMDRLQAMEMSNGRL